MDYRKLFEEFSEKGCIKIENFLIQDEVEDMVEGMNDIIENMTDEDIHVHSAYSNHKTKADKDYYINSGDKISFFFEPDALDEDGNLLMDKKEALNRIAYALHWWNPNFKRVSFSQKVKDLLLNFGYKDPVVAHSMLIFKKPKIGELIRPHQDATFLYTEPVTCLGLWFPLEDATLENGCLWFLPGSHKDGVHQRYVRNPDRDPFMIMKGQVPESDESLYVPVPARKGDCVLIHGTVLHKSERNYSKRSRAAYTYHVVESSAEWSEENWLQPTERLPFPHVYEN